MSSDRIHSVMIKVEPNEPENEEENDIHTLLVPEIRIKEEPSDCNQSSPPQLADQESLSNQQCDKSWAFVKVEKLEIDELSLQDIEKQDEESDSKVVGPAWKELKTLDDAKRRKQGDNGKPLDTNKCNGDRYKRKSGKRPRKQQNKANSKRKKDKNRIDEIAQRKKEQNKIRCKRYRDKKKNDEILKSHISKPLITTVEEEELIKLRREKDREKSKRYRDRIRTTKLINSPTKTKKSAVKRVVKSQIFRNSETPGPSTINDPSTQTSDLSKHNVPCTTESHLFTLLTRTISKKHL